MSTTFGPATLAYSLVAWLVGTFFVACAYFADAAQSWGREGRWISGFVYVYALALAGGLSVQIVAAVLLRKLARVTGLNDVIHWTGFGAGLGLALPWMFSHLGYSLEKIYFPHEWQNVKSALMFPLMGAMMYQVHSPWVLIAVGAATGGTLRLAMRYVARRSRLQAFDDFQ